MIEFNILNTKYNITKETVLVLMSTYNRTAPIIKSVDSIVNQNYSNVLLHIVDDNSTENVIGLLTDYITKNEINNVKSEVKVLREDITEIKSLLLKLLEKG